MSRAYANPEEPLEFTLGPLSTDTGRVERARSQRVGLQHADQLSPLDPSPGEEITISIRVGLGVSLESAKLFYSLDGSKPDPVSPASGILKMSRATAAWDTLSWSYLETWAAVIPAQPEGTLVRYMVRALTTSGEEIPCPFVSIKSPQTSISTGKFDQRYLHRLQRNPVPPVYEFRVDSLGIPAWLQDAVIYQIFVDRFASSSGEPLREMDDLNQPTGGNLRGIISRLDYLANLGINCLWLTPIFPAASYHGYDPLAHTGIDPHLGNLQDFQDLIREAHTSGIRVLLDFVANHVSNHHPAFVAAQKSAGSPQGKWFFFRSHSGDYESFFDVPGQPILNTDNPDVRAYLTEAAEHWLKMGCDGLRLDHAHGASHAFWSEFRTATRIISGESALIGEITDTPEAVLSFAGRMDGALDFQLAELLRKFFGYCSLPPSWFMRELDHHYLYFNGRMALPSFLDNHDMNRFLWLTGGNKTRLKLAALCQFTLPQPPIIYYGTEVGLGQRQVVGALEEARLPMPWGERQDHDLLDFYTRLIRFRRENTPSLASGRVVELVDDERGILVYRVGGLVCAFNNSPEPVWLDLQIKETLIANEESVRLEPTGVYFPAWAGAVFRSST